MASLCRSALASSSRSIAAHSRTISQKTLTPKAKSVHLLSSTTAIPRVSRVLSALGSADSMMPLHSAIASARLRSRIAVDSSCWSLLSQDFAVPR